ncbi:MAG: hypothetical protein ACKVJN_16890 [Woeseiales bacterium]
MPADDRPHIDTRMGSFFVEPCGFGHASIIGVDSRPPLGAADEQALSICKLDHLNDCEPTHALMANVDLVVIRYDDTVSVSLWTLCAPWRANG